MENFQNSSIKVHRLTFFPEFHADLSRYKENKFIVYPLQNTHFAAILRPFGPGRQNFSFEVSQTENVK